METLKEQWIVRRRCSDGLYRRWCLLLLLMLFCCDLSCLFNWCRRLLLWLVGVRTRFDVDGWWLLLLLLLWLQFWCGRRVLHKMGVAVLLRRQKRKWHGAQEKRKDRDACESSCWCQRMAPVALQCRWMVVVVVAAVLLWLWLLFLCGVESHTKW